MPRVMAKKPAGGIGGPLTEIHAWAANHVAAPKIANSGATIATTPKVPSLLLVFSIAHLSWLTHMPWRADRQRWFPRTCFPDATQREAVRRCARETPTVTPSRP